MVYDENLEELRFFLVKWRKKIPNWKTDWTFQYNEINHYNGEEKSKMFIELSWKTECDSTLDVREFEANKEIFLLY